MSNLSSAAPAAQSSAQPGSAISILILAIAAFVIVTTEYLIVGLLPALSRDLDISISAAGQLVTLFAFTVMLFGPPLTAWLSHLDRKVLFVAILLVFALSNALAALAPNIWVLSLARFIPALALPVFWGALAGTTNVSAANAGIGIGAMLGGLVIPTLGLDKIGYISAAIALLAVAVAPVVASLAPKKSAC
jgi:predicted MFS family arabinose efflux permease